MKRSNQNGRKEVNNEGIQTPEIKNDVIKNEEVNNNEKLKLEDTPDNLISLSEDELKL